MTFGHDTFGINSHVFHAWPGGTEDDFTGDKVKVFKHCIDNPKFNLGWVKEFGEGSYGKGDFPANEASALWIPEGYTVVASDYHKDREEFPGLQMTFVGPRMVKCLIGEGFDNDIDHLEITYNGSNGNNNGNNNGNDNGNDNGDSNGGFFGGGNGDEEEGGINWLLIGGIAVAAVFLIK